MSWATPEDLAEAGLVGPQSVEGLRAVAGMYAVAITPALPISSMSRDRDDPIAANRAVRAERETATGESAIPSAMTCTVRFRESSHRYDDRVLLKLHACLSGLLPFCFRREMVGPGEDQVLSPRPSMRRSAISPPIAEFGSDPDRRRPFHACRPEAARGGNGATRRHRQVKVLRWHTRMRVADPERVTDELVLAINRRKRLMSPCM